MGRIIPSVFTNITLFDMTFLFFVNIFVLVPPFDFSDISHYLHFMSNRAVIGYFDKP